MHPLVQDGHDTDFVTRKPPPVDEMKIVQEEEALTAKHCRDQPLCHAVAVDPVECSVQRRDVENRLFGSLRAYQAT